MEVWRQCDIPVHGGDHPAKMLLCLLRLQGFHVGVDAACFLEGGDAATHPGRTALEFVVGGENWPVKRVFQGYQPVDGADGLALEKGFRDGGDTVGVTISVAIGVAIGVTIGVAISVTFNMVVAVGLAGGMCPRCRDLGSLSAVQVLRILIPLVSCPTISRCSRCPYILIADGPALRLKGIDLHRSRRFLVVPIPVSMQPSSRNDEAYHP